MDGLNRSDAKPEHAADLEDEEIIDLTQVVEDDDDGIIELTDVLTQPDQPAAGDTPDDDDVIPLVDAIQTETLETETSDTDDEAIIDLTDVAPVDVSGAGADETAFEEPGIDLSDLEETLESELDAPEVPTAEAPVMDDIDDGTPAEDDTVIDLLDVADTLEPPVVEPETAPPSIDSSRVDDGGAIADTIDADAAQADDAPAAPEAETIIDAMMPPAAPVSEAVEPQATDETGESDVSVAGAVWPEPDAVTVDTPEDEIEPGLAPEPALSDEQVSAALERVIEKVYGDRIEALLVDTIEKTVRREIEKIRNALLAEDDPSFD